MLVLRVENATRQGCYYSSIFAGAFRAHEQGGCGMDLSIHPTPEHDEELCDEWKAITDSEHKIAELYSRFCFTSAEQYFRWFHTKKARRILREEMFSLAIYDVEDAYLIASQHQGIFDLRYAENATPLGGIKCDAPIGEIEDALTVAQAGTLLVRTSALLPPRYYKARRAA
jgi:hypothetical protein